MRHTFRSCFSVLLICASALAGCSSDQDDTETAGSREDGTVPAGADDAVGATTGSGATAGAPTSDGATSGAARPSSVSSSSSPPPATTTTSSTPTVPQAGTLTAGAWDDNRNFDFFLAYRDQKAQALGPSALAFAREEIEAAKLAYAGQRAPKQKIDVALMIDTTGSMGDELRYLQTELVAIATTVRAKYPDAGQRWSLVFYRDQGDEYVTRVFDFQADAEPVRQNLGAQSAGGGGDFPEAPDAAFAVLNKLSWRNDASVARVVFWVADAPHHADRAAALAEAVRATRKLDIHVYPVASSGLDELTELSMRSAAQLTGGRYLFLTDDSGVGSAHKEPTLPCYFVTRLDHALVRMVDAELSGTYTEPSASQVIRTSGNPQSGVCTLASGQQLQPF